MCRRSAAEILINLNDNKVCDKTLEEGNVEQRGNKNDLLGYYLLINLIIV